MLVSKKTVRLTHPTEPGAWVEVRLPLSAGDTELMRDGSLVSMITIDVLAAVITAWSEPHPISLETVRQLDLDTFNWLASEVQSRSGIMDDPEKKASNESSSPTTEPATEVSQPSLGT
ncbi:MAG: hypothetical protein IT301_05235 [Dehalococcoidia bacterium]|nr:hypothetical protein [Dehalococcoidia bacterium]